MAASARKLSRLAPVNQTFATVVGTGDQLLVDSGQGPQAAKRAFGCLVEPALGDRVLVASDGSAGYVLAVLERCGAEPAQIVLDGDARFRLPQGRLRLSARDGIELDTAGELALGAARTRISSAEVEAVVGSASLIGSQLEYRFEKLRSFVTLVEAMATTVCERVGALFRRVDEVERVEAAQIDYRADEAFSVHGRYVLTTADELVKIDSEQIHLG